MKFIGLDVHKRSTNVCMLNENGKVVKEFRVRGPVSEVVERLSRLRSPFVVCYEASCGYGCLHDQLRRIACRVVVAHPGQVRFWKIRESCILPSLFVNHRTSCQVPTGV